MIALPPVDPADFIMKAGDEMQKCINKLFNEVSLEEAANAEILDEKFAPDCLAKLQAEYYKKLEIIWASIPTYYHSSFEAVYKNPPLNVAGDLDALGKITEDEQSHADRLQNLDSTRSKVTADIANVLNRDVKELKLRTLGTRTCQGKRSEQRTP